jgi:hypothetical protein
MTRRINTAIDIHATPARVWEVLTDFERYGEWNPFIHSADGTPRVGGRLTLKMTAAGRSFTVRPTVVEVGEDRVLRWLGRLGVRGLLDAEHTHTIQATATGARYIQQETFRGILVPFVGKTLAATETAFERMNVELRRRAEEAEGRHVAEH